jgi:hypothetical protein
MVRWRWDCTRRGCFVASGRQLDLEIFDGLLPGASSFSDVDGFTERRGRFLFIEAKGEGVPVPDNTGQGRALRQLATLPGVTVWFIRPLGDRWQWRDLGAGPRAPLVTLTKVELDARVWAWGLAADRGEDVTFCPHAEAG